MRKAIAGIGLVTCVCGLAALGLASIRAQLTLPSPTRLLTDQHGIYLGEVDIGSTSYYHW